jgi:tRNA modification GTPase
MMEDTIFALASGYGRAAIQILRLSGPKTREIIQSGAEQLPAPRSAKLVTLKNQAGDIVDRGLLLWFPGPHSFTGEDCAEFQLHGGAAITDAVFRWLKSFEACRLAAPGEFTRRAIQNGKMSLVEAEGLIDLIDAETDVQRRQALDQTLGGLSTHIEQWRSQLLDVLMLVEALIDFSDEADVNPAIFNQIENRLRTLQKEFASAIQKATRGEQIREGFRVLLAGAPNAGKSTLLNALAERDVAIVSAIPGTTRDVIEVKLDLKGYPVIILDTAGVHETLDIIEQEGIRRTLREADRADLILWLEPVQNGVSPLPDEFEPFHDKVIRVGTKADQSDVLSSGLNVSAINGSGIDILLDHILHRFTQGSETTFRENAVLTRARHRNEVEIALVSVEDALASTSSGNIEFIAEDIRLALKAIGRITHSVGSEEVLDRLFAGFCIGK